MRNILLLSSTLFAVVLITGCGGATPDIADETNTTVKQVQDDTSKATTKKTDKDEAKDEGEKLEGNQDNQETMMQTLENSVKTIYFDYDIYIIRTDMVPIIEENAVTLNAEDAKPFKIKIEGNCDEFGTDEYNYALGLNRANSAKKALIAQGIDENRLTLVSFGEANPTCTEKSKECWSKNRRVDFKILP